MPYIWHSLCYRNRHMDCSGDFEVSRVADDIPVNYENYFIHKNDEIMIQNIH